MKLLSYLTGCRICLKINYQTTGIGTTIFRLCIIGFFMQAPLVARAQSFSINSDGSAAHSSAMLDVKSTIKGMLLPRMTEVQRNAIALPATGLLIYQTDNQQGLYYYNGAVWIQFASTLSGLWQANGNHIYNTNTGNAGIGTTTPLSRLHIKGGGLLLDSTAGSVLLEGPGTRMMWIPNKGAFRAGRADLFDLTYGGYDFDSATIGLNSFAAGYNARASGNFSFAGGYYTHARGESSFAIGYGSVARESWSFSIGKSVNANAPLSIVIGENSTTTGTGAIAQGYDITSNYYRGLAVGLYNDTLLSGSRTLIDPLNRIFQVGNGTSDLNRKNAITVLQNGNTGIGELNPAVPLNFASTLGNKIALWGNSTNHYGLGIQPSLLQLYTMDASNDITFGYGNSNAFTENMRIKGNGNVGIGVTNPGLNLVVKGDINVDAQDANNGAVAGSLRFGGIGSGEFIASKRTAGNNQYGLDFYTLATSRMSITLGGNVGVGTNTPAARFHVADSSVVFSAIGDIPTTPVNTPVNGPGRRMLWYPDKAAFRAGYASGTYWNKDSIGNYSVAFGTSVLASGNNSFSIGGDNQATGDYSGGFGEGNRAQGTTSICVGYKNFSTGDHAITLGTFLQAKSYSGVAVGLYNDTTYSPNPTAISSFNRVFEVGNGTGALVGGRSNAMTILQNGNVGIGTTSPLQRLHVAGNICYTGTIGACSDIRYKTDFSPLNHSLQKVLSLQGMYYNWRLNEFPEMHFSDNKQIGFAAQELEKLFPELVMTDSKGYKSVDYGRLTPVLVEAIKEQQKMIELLMNEVQELKVKRN